MLGIQAHSQVVRNLSACRYDNTVRIFQVKDVHDTLECQLVEVKTVAHIIVGRNRLGIIVNHHRTISFLTDRVQCLHTAPVKFYRRTDTVSTRAEYDNRLVVA